MIVGNKQVVSTQDMLVAAAKLKDPGASIRWGEALVKGISENDKSLVSKAMFHVQSLIELPFRFADSIVAGRLEGAIQAFTTVADIPKAITDTFTSFRSLSSYDLRADQAFKNVVMEQFQDYIEIVDVDGGLAISKVVEGEAVQLGKSSGSILTIPSVEYGGGLQWSWKLLEKRKFQRMIQLAEEFRDRMVIKRQQVKYQVLCEAGAANARGTIAFDTTGSTTYIEKLIRTINTTADALSADMKDKADVDAATAPFLIFCHASDSIVQALNAALKYSTIMGGTSASGVAITARQITLLPTYMLKYADGTAVASDTSLMVMPGRKIQYADDVLPTTYTDQDITTFSTIQTVRFSNCTGVGDVKQCLLFKHQ